MPPSKTRIEVQKRRERVFDLAASGKSPKEIAYYEKISHGYALKILSDYGFAHEYITPTEWRIIKERRAIVGGTAAT